MLVRLWRFLIPVFILLLAVVLVRYLYLTRPQPEPLITQEPVARVEVYSLEQGSFSPSIILYASVIAPQRFQAAAPAAGKLTQLNIREGQKVREGELLAVMDESDFLPEIESLKAKIEAIDSQIRSEKVRKKHDAQALKYQMQLLELGKNALKRSLDVQEKKLGSVSEIETAKAQVLEQQLAINTLQAGLESYASRIENLQASRRQALSELKTAETTYTRSRFHAPYDGIIEQVNVAVGDHLAVRGILFSMYSLSHLELRASLPYFLTRTLVQAQGRAEKIYAIIEDGQATREHRSVLLRLAGRATANAVDAFFSLDEQFVAERGLRPGSMLVLRLLLPVKDNVFKAPHSALYGKNTIYKLVKDADSWRMRRVTVQLQGDYFEYDTDNQTEDRRQNYVLFRSNQLKQGDQIVITHLPHAIDGLKVENISSR